MLAAVLLGALLASAPVTETDCARDELLGPVHTVEATFQSLKKDPEGAVDTSRQAAWSDTYDVDCNEIEHKQNEVDFVADEHPKRIDATTVIVQSNMGSKKVRSRYDGSGKLIESWTTTLPAGTFYDHRSYLYDANGRVVRIDSFDENGKPYGFTTYVRDPGGHVVREDIDLGDGRKVVETYTYEFDARGNWIKEVESGTDPDRGVTTIQPIGILFRTITYYETKTTENT